MTFESLISPTISSPQVRRLLVVDDEEGPRESLNMIFGDDFDVTIAASGEEAVQFSLEEPFHVVITDIRMRGISGIDVLRELKKIDPHTEVIVLTAYETLETAREAISLGASEYLKKPFGIDHVQRVVSRCYEKYLFTANQDAVIRRDLNAAKNNFLEILSHELNTPMNGLMGFIDLLEYTELDEDQGEYVDTIRDCSLKCLEHVQDILTYAKLSTSESEISTGSFNPVTLLLKQLSELPEKTGVEIVTDISDDIPELLSGPEQEIRLVIRKLLHNAIKFTESGRVTASMRCESTGRDSYDFVVSVADTGTGISSELIKDGRIFDAFTLGDSSLKRTHGGLGLGLSLCQGLCSRIGATISVDSRVGEGSLFTFRFSLVDDSC